MKVYHPLFIVLFTLGVVHASPVEENKFEVITDIDLGFFASPPKLPWGGDPFLKQPGFAKVTAAPAHFTLGGIVFSQDIPMAIVNGKKVKIGDQVEDRQVSDIGDNYVLLKKQGSEIELTLPPLQDEVDDDQVREETKK